MCSIITKLQRRFPSAHIYFYTGVEKVAEAGSADRYHMEDRFAIVFDTKPKALDAVPSKFVDRSHNEKL